ncbi:MAG: FUSC family protein [Thiotrichaceae bacterium]|nr:FUSC family protein [Thiotrichaceae bacterium]
MNKSIKQLITEEIKALSRLNKTTRPWHIALLAAVCTGIPLLLGLYFNNFHAGIIACLAGVMTLYMPATALPNRMITLLACSFGFMISLAVGICFSFNPIVSSIVFGLFALSIHWVILFFKIKPPGSFFFILIASIAGGMPFDPHTIPEKIGLIGLGTMLFCLLALIYSLLTIKKTQLQASHSSALVMTKTKYSYFVDASIMGLFMFASSLLGGYLLKLQNPYWIPISCAAIMQGTSLYHVWQKTIHRILGTFIGLGLSWILLFVTKTPLAICISIIILQFIIEILVVKHYALAAIFITPLTILLAEAGNPLLDNPDMLISTRFLDIVLGSFIGAIGGWLIHHEKLRQHAVFQLRKIRVALKRRQRKEQ